MLQKRNHKNKAQMLKTYTSIAAVLFTWLHRFLMKFSCIILGVFPGLTKFHLSQPRSDTQKRARETKVNVWSRHD